MIEKAKARTIVEWVQLGIDAKQAPFVSNYLYTHVFEEMERLQVENKELKRMIEYCASYIHQVRKLHKIKGSEKQSESDVYETIMNWNLPESEVKGGK